VLLAGLAFGGTFDTTADDAGIAAGARSLTALALVAVALGVVGYAVVEWLQTRRIESIARQFGTRTIVLIPFAIALNIVLGQTVGAALRLPIYLDSVGTILVGVLAGPLAGAATGVLSNLAWTFLLAGTPFGSAYAWPFAVVAAEIGFVAGIVGQAGLLRSRPQTPVPTLVAGVVATLATLGVLAFVVVLPFYRTLCGGPTTYGDSALCAPVPLADTQQPLFFLVGLVILGLIALAVVGFLVRLAKDRDLGAVFALAAGAVCGVLSALIAAPIATLVFGGVTGGGTDLLVLAFLQAGSDLQTAVVQQSLLSDSIDKAITYVLVFVLLASASRRAIARFPQGPKVIRQSEA
jgi:riboflavin transporter FmnP